MNAFIAPDTASSNFQPSVRLVGLKPDLHLIDNLGSWHVFATVTAQHPSTPKLATNGTAVTLHPVPALGHIEDLEYRIIIIWRIGVSNSIITDVSAFPIVIYLRAHRLSSLWADVVQIDQKVFVFPAMRNRDVTPLTAHAAYHVVMKMMQIAIVSEHGVCCATEAATS
jgi:hypothetical protein